MTKRVSMRQVHAANERAADLLRTGPVALSARFDIDVRALCLQLADGSCCMVGLNALPWLKGASPHELSVVQVSPAGLGIRFPALDVDIYLPDLVSRALNQGDAVVFSVHWSVEDAAFVGLCWAFPSLSWCAESYQAAFKGIRRLVDDVVADLRASGEPVPPFFATDTGNETAV